MGINSLNKLLRNRCPDVFETIHLSEYAYKKVAVDLTLFLCKFKSAYGDRWLSAFLNLVSCLRKNEIHCIFIYEVNSPPEKEAEREKRTAQREKNEMRVYMLEEALNEYHRTGEIAECLIELDRKEKEKSKTPRRLLHNKDTSVNMSFVEYKVEKMRSYILKICKEDFLVSKQLFDILNVPYYEAPLEAETMCADLCKRGVVDAVLSDDTDVLAYSSPVFLNKINTSHGTCVRIFHSQVLESLDLEDREFLDLCIMCGTDYNKNIPRVGPENAYKYITKYRTIEGVAEGAKLDVSILNHEMSRRMFLEYERSEVESVPYCGAPDFDKLREFVFKYNLELNVDSFQESFSNNIIIFDENGNNSGGELDFIEYEE